MRQRGEDGMNALMMAALMAGGTVVAAVVGGIGLTALWRRRE